MSWVLQLRELCLQYHLPHPIILLNQPMSKLAFKTLVRNHVQSFWQEKLRHEASCLTSLVYFRPAYMSLSRPHPLWTTAKFNPYESNKARIQARMLSGRYRTEAVCRFWSSNSGGYCLLPACEGLETKEDIKHVLVHCESLSFARAGLINFVTSQTSSLPILQDEIQMFLNSDPDYKT